MRDLHTAVYTVRRVEFAVGNFNDLARTRVKFAGT